MLTYHATVIDGNIRIASQETPVPEPGPQQLLVRMYAAGLNRGEVLALRAAAPAGAEPAALGIEAAGEVVGIGQGVRSFHIGNRVMGRCRAAFSEYVLMDARDAIPVPEPISWVDAAAISIAHMVVYDMLIGQGRLAAGEWLMITGVSSGVGVAALLLAKALGARVIGTSGSPQKLAELKRLGLDVGVPTRAADFHDAVKEATEGHGADLIVNITGGSVFAECLRCLAFEGRLATVGYMDGVLDARIDLKALHAKRLTLFGVSSKGYGPDQRHRLVQGVADTILPFFVDGRISPVIDKVFPFEDLASAINHMESDAQLGKIVLTGRQAISH